ncbi:hypothetical protein MKW92_048291 [Papaver armeniacum]|nr:hypothetical protein MKW92_048291 [Papaver armeniacum]
MKVTVVSRSGREIIKATVSDLQEAIHARTKKYYPSRQRLTLPLSPGSKDKPTVLNSKTNLSDYCDAKKDNLTVVFKDLGPQVSYQILFFWEYVGHYLVYKFLGYKEERVIHPVQTYAMYYWCFHYFKRIMETFFRSTSGCFNIATQTVAGYVFLVVAASIMSNWALLKREGRKYPSKMWVILPPFL